MRALAGAIALGSSAGLVIGAAYLAGSAVKEPTGGPAPPASGSLQASLGPPHAKTSLPPQIAVAAPPAPVPLRARFRVAAEALHAAAQPFHFRTVADAPSDLHCLTEAVYFEARGEAPAGQQAVAQVVLNRVRHPAFPKTICAVVHQHTGAGCQFSFACSNQQAALNGVAWRRAETIASSEMHGAVMTAVGDATHFQAARASPFAGLLKVAQVGAHMFYRFGGHAGAPAMFHQAPSVSTEPARVELAELDPAAAPKAVPTALTGGRVRVTLDPGMPNAAPAPAPAVPAPVAVKLVSATSAAARPAAAQSALTPPATPPGRVEGTPAAKPAITAVALAQS